MKAFYFGTWGRAGHWLYDEYGEKQRYDAKAHFGNGIPWEKIDNRLNPNMREGEAALHHKDGWTAIAFANYMDDDRPGCNSVFLFDQTLTFDEALTAAKERFPRLWQAIKFDVKQVA